MANKPRIVVALPKIIGLLRGMGKGVFSEIDLQQIFDSNKDVWRLPLAMDLETFMKGLAAHSNLQIHSFAFPSFKERSVLHFEDTSIYEVSANILPKSYLSHYSAIVAWGLTEQIPKTVYISEEQSNSPSKSTRRELSQSAIDNAFKKPQRLSDTFLNYKDYRLVVLRGKHTDNLGVRELDTGNSGPLRVTDIERTLIDIAVRPAYSGGVYEVLKAYRNAKAKYKVSVNKLSGYLNRMDFIYPYHQVIGFYLERAGNYQPNMVELLKNRPQEFDFYMTYEMGEMEYSKEWRLYYPKGMA